jgi:hypothetical protein
MFGKKKDVLQVGIPAQAVILSARPGNMLSGHGERNWDVVVRVHYVDGQTADVNCGYLDLTSYTVGDALNSLELYPMSPGVVVPVRYDPDDRARVEIDRPKIIADTISAYETERAKKIARAERQLAGPAAPSQHDNETDEAYLFDALTAAETRGDTVEAQRLTALIEKLLPAEGQK